MENIPLQAERHSGERQKLFAFPPESVFTFGPECCSESQRNGVRLQTGITFAFDRIPQPYDNCWTDASWFFPALTALSSSDPSIVLSYSGAETRFGVAVQHLTSFRAVSADSQPLTQMDFYLDATTLLPVSVVFDAHPDNGSTVNIPIEIQFTDYQMQNGMQFPMHIQKFLQGSLLLDLQVTNVSVNTGLQDSLFSIQ